VTANNPPAHPVPWFCVAPLSGYRHLDLGCHKAWCDALAVARCELSRRLGRVVTDSEFEVHQGWLTGAGIDQRGQWSVVKYG
jgi:hypothetical protein